jgi:hypothetical protein
MKVLKRDIISEESKPNVQFLTGGKDLVFESQTFTVQRKMLSMVRRNSLTGR